MGLFRLRLLLKRNKMSLVIPPTFQHILRVMNTNIDGKRNIQYAITAIKGVGRRYANLVLKKADIDLSKRAGELSEEDVEKIIRSCKTLVNTKFPTGSLTDKRTSRMVKPAKLWLTFWTINCVRIWND